MTSLLPVRIVNNNSAAEELLERLYGYPRTPRKRRLADNGSPGPAHHHYPCTDCPKGFITTPTHENKCPACSTGLYQASNGQTSCPDCPVGWKQGSTGQAACVQCGTGQFQDEGSKDGCKICPVGWRQGSNHQTNCAVCSVGQFQEVTTQASCKQPVEGEIRIFTFSDLYFSSTNIFRFFIVSAARRATTAQAPR